MEDFRSRWERKYHFAHNVYTSTQKLLMAQDAKAGVVVTINCFVIGILSSEFSLARRMLEVGGQPLALRIGFFVAVLLFLFVLVKSTLHAFSTFLPRFQTEDKIQYTLKRLVFAGHILEKKSPDEYYNQVLVSTDGDLMMELTAQIWQISGIFQEKFTHCRKAIDNMQYSLWLALVLTAFTEISLLLE